MKLSKVIGYVLDSKLFISGCAVCMAMASCLVLGILYNVPLLVFVFCGTFLIYNVAVIPEVIRGSGSQDLFFRMLLLLCFPAAVACSLALKPVVFLCMLPFVLIAVFYYIPSRTSALSAYSLRNIPLLKIFLIAGVWTGITAMLPAFQQDIALKDPSLIWLLAERFVFILAITIPFDVRDMAKDRKEGIVTIASLAGVKGTRWLSTGMHALFLLLTFMQFGLSPIFYARACCVLALLVVTFRIQADSEEYFYTGLIDGGMALQLVILYCFL